MQSVGIITLPGRFNYGNRLQNYATQRVLESCGLESHTLVWDSRPNPVESLKNVARRVLGKRAGRPEDWMDTERLAAFDRFNERIRFDYVGTITADVATHYDWFGVGSDQVWNPNFIQGYEDVYLLDFARREQRVALAASVGVTALKRGEQRRFGGAWKAFSKLSVRERAGANLVAEASGRAPTVLCDPTLAIGRTEWESVASDVVNPRRPYVMSYLLGEADAWRTRLVDGLARRYGAQVRALSQGQDGTQLPAGPAEFVGLIAGARHVVTDSFHAAVFASLFERPLTIVQRRESGPSMFCRMDTLSEKLELQGKIILEGQEPDLDAAADYAGVAERIAAEQEAFRGFVRGCCELIGSSL